MEQRETSPAPLPDPKGALPIPAHFRLPFQGKMETPTAVPSPTQRRYHIDTVRKRRRKQFILGGLAAVEITTLILLVALRATPVLFMTVGGGSALVVAAIGFFLIAAPKKSGDAGF